MKPMPLEFFAPLVKQVFDRKAYDPAVINKGARVKLSDEVMAAQRKAL